MDYSPLRQYEDELALEVKDLHKFYGVGYGAYHALRGLNMKVSYGTIYGLLGASGCGKTTLLRCVLGRLPIRSGHILTLGKPPGAKGHGVPGKDVGYMPQEEALAPEFTMKEIMYYFGILFGMNLKEIKRRMIFLTEFLDITMTKSLCGKLSGGQKRRVSLAAALIHEPPLLILDEPTVGVDPLLRAKIWSHLLDITSAGNTTIVVTTHYIEEAGQAHVVGLMRSGRLLAQARPDDLVRAHNAVSLEDVFLRLSEEQELLTGSNDTSFNQSARPTEATPLLTNTNVNTIINYSGPSLLSSIQCDIPRLPKLVNVAVLSWKEAIKFVRQPM